MSAPRPTRPTKVSMANIFLKDARVNCLSGMGQINAAEYLSLVEAVYRETGGIEGQRAPLKTKTGINIRKRMVEDIKNGALTLYA